MAVRSWKWTDAHYCSLPSQTNVYGLTKINSNGTNRLLVASLKGDFVSVEYQKLQNKLKPCTRSVQFTYIPNDAEIVSIDVMSKSEPGSGLVVGITFIRLQHGGVKPTGQFLNLYFSFEEGNETKEDIMAKTIELSFVPYQLTHTFIIKENNEKESVFLLCGSDNQIHMYKDKSDNNYHEENPKDYFIEFKKWTSSVLQLAISYIDNFHKRLTAVGFQNGSLEISLVDVEDNVLLQSWQSNQGSPITSIIIFNPQNQVHCPSFIESSENGANEEKPTIVYDILVTSTLAPAVVYRNVLKNGLEYAVTLPNSEKFDSPLCSCVVDIDFDGHNEILIGTYGQELLAYKSENSDSRIAAKKDAVANQTSKNMFELLWTRSFAYPVVGLDSLDIMGDGMEDLAVVTLNGLHILQPDLSEVAKVCLERLHLLADTGSESGDPYLELQNEVLEGEIGNISN